MKFLIALIVLFIFLACSDDKTAGTVTDTGNTLANIQVAGVVHRTDGTPANNAKVRMARLSVYDSVLHVPEHVDTVTDSLGAYAFNSALADTFQLVVIDTIAAEVFYLPRTTLKDKAYDSIKLERAAVLNSVLYYNDDTSVSVGSHFITCILGTPFCESVFAADSFTMLMPKGSWSLEVFPGDPQIVTKLLQSDVSDTSIYRTWNELVAKSGDTLNVGPFVWSVTAGLDSIMNVNAKNSQKNARIFGTILCKNGSPCENVEAMLIKDIYGFSFTESDSLEFVANTKTDSLGRWWLPLPSELVSDSFRVEFRKLQDGIVEQTGVSRYVNKSEIAKLKDTLDLGKVTLSRASALESGVALVVNIDDSTQSNNCMVNSVVVGIKGTSHFIRGVTCNMFTLTNLPMGEQQIVLYSGDKKILETLVSSKESLMDYVIQIGVSLPENATQKQQWMTYTPPSQNIF